MMGERMVVTQGVFDALKAIGLNLYERKLWVALLSRGTATAGELSSLAKVPHSRTYDVLESLAEKGFVLIQTSKPLKYVAIAPREALERAKRKLMEDTNAALERLTSLQSSAALRELEQIYKKGMQLIEPGELMAALKGRTALHNQLESIFKGAKNNISIITTSAGLADLHAKHADLLKLVAKKGIKIRIATPVDRENGAIVQALQGIAEVRRLPPKYAAGRFWLVDGAHVVLALTDERKVHPTQDLMLWAQSDHVTRAVLSPMFEALWKSLPNA
jgi:sugar-specific transcriptional regulator TrmB